MLQQEADDAQVRRVGGVEDGRREHLIRVAVRDDPAPVCERYRITKTNSRTTITPIKTLFPYCRASCGMLSIPRANVLVLSSCLRSAFMGRGSVVRGVGQSNRDGRGTGPAPGR